MKHFLLRTVLTVVFITNVFEVVAESVTVNLTREGTLAEKVLEQASSLATVTDLTIIGKFNNIDWDCVLQQMTHLETLNMKEAIATFETMKSFPRSVMSFIMPMGVKYLSIGDAHSGYNMDYLEISNSVEKIMGGSMPGMLTKIRVGNNLKYISGRPFEDIPELQSIHFSDIQSFLNIEYESFKSCFTTNLFFNRLYDYNWDADNEFQNTKTIYINDEILTKVELPPFQKLNKYAFAGCTSLQEVVFNDEIEEIGDGAFFACTNLSEISLPSSINKIGDNAFKCCKQIEQISIPIGVTQLGNFSFAYCYNLNKIDLPSTLTHIQNSVFEYCSSINEIIFPESVVSIGNNAFYGCSGLTKVTSLIPFPISVSGGIFSGINQDACTLVVPEWSALLYKMAVGWSEFSKIETVATGDLALLTVNDNRYLPESVRPNGTPDVYVSEEGSLTVRGNKEFNMNELTLNIEIGDDDNYNYIEYYTPSLYGSCLFNDESNLTAKSAKLGLKSKGATWGFITLPFDANLSDITPMVEGDVNNYIWKTYDGERRALLGSGGNWKEATGTLKAGIGYIYQSQNNDSIFVKAIASTLSNMLSNGDITLPLKTYAANDAEDENWNFIGNPYPTYFNTRYIDFTAPVTVWNGNGYDAISLTDDDYTLAPCQAFFVQKQEDTESIKFFAEGRTTEYSQSNNNNNNTRAKLYNATTSERNIINLYLEGANYKDKSRIVFNEKAKLNYELNCDATKFMNEDANIPQLYSIDNGGCQYAINERPEGDGYVTLGILVPETGQYTISVDKINLAKEIYLIDTKENIVTELTSADYTFYSDATTSNSRFILSLDKNATGINNMNVDSSCVNITNKGIIISNALGDRVEVYTLDGKCVYDAVVSNQHETIAMNKGTYVVKVGEKSFKTVIK